MNHEQPDRNAPGLPALSYRSGTHGSILARLVEALGDEHRPGLAGLTTRDREDLTLGMLDAFASMADVLTFYQERIANEHYLRTAVERLSVHELAALVNYQLKPGKAADAFLAFLLDTADGSPQEVPLVAGIKVDSVPGPDEEMQTFETVEEFTARPEWNEIRPRMSRPPSISEVKDQGWALLGGVALSISKGDRLMVAAGDRSLMRVTKVSVNKKAGTTTVEFGAAPEPIPWAFPFIQAVLLATPQVMELTTAPLTTTWIGAQVQSAVWNQTDLITQAATMGQSVPSLTAAIIATPLQLTRPSVPEPVVEGLSVFRTTASVFGHNANPIDADGNPAADQPDKVSKELRGIGTRKRLPLDAVHKGIAAGTWMAVETVDKQDAAFYEVHSNDTASLLEYQMSAKVSMVEIETTTNDDLDERKTRETVIYAEPEDLVLAEIPITDHVAGDVIVLERAHLDLEIGQEISITGTYADLDGVTGTEVRSIRDMHLASGVTVVTLDVALEGTYARDSVVIRANLVRATHGATVERVLGSGDGTKTFQQFDLPDVPLTYVAANNPAGVASTLEVRVDGIRWHERADLAHSGPHDRVYAVRHRENGTVAVMFGDGITGARLPTGAENVTATYRVGIGRDGLVTSGQLSLPAIKPQGVKEVMNPAPATDAADVDTIDEARKAAPNQVMTLGRVVSLRDYEDFARNYAGVAKALASWVWVGEERRVVVSIAGTGGEEFPPGHEKLTRLEQSLWNAGDRSAIVHVVSYRPAQFVLSAGVFIDSDYDQDVVLADIRGRLRSAYGFDRRALGHPVFRSQIITDIQQTRGVVAVDLDMLDRRTANEPGNYSRLDAALPIRGERLVGTAPADVEGAELLMLDPRPIDLEEADA